MLALPIKKVLSHSPLLAAVAIVMVFASIQVLAQAGARVEPIPLEALTEQQRALIGITEGQPMPPRAYSNLFRTLLHNTELMTAYTPFGDSINRTASFTPRLRELIILRVASNYQGEYETQRHRKKALQVGWSTADLARIEQWPHSDGWSELETALIMATDQLANNAYIEQPVWNMLRRHYSEADILAMIGLVAHYHWVTMMTQSMRVQLE